MSARYEVRLKNHLGEYSAILSNWIRLTYVKQVNRTGYYSLWLQADQIDVSVFTLDSQIEVWREDPDAEIEPYIDFEGFHRTPVHQRVKVGPTMFTSYGRGYNDLLNRRYILYYPQTDQAVKSGVAETVMREYVDENAGPSATSPPRLKHSGVTPGLSMMPDLVRGDQWEGSRPYKNLLTVCQEIAEVGNIDFQIVGSGPATFLFHVYENLGVDRTDTGFDRLTGLNGAGYPPTIFDVERANMIIPIYSDSRNDEVSKLIMLGQGQLTARQIEIISSGREEDSPWNLIEGRRQSSNQDTVAGLRDLGQAYIEKLGPQESFTFDYAQTEATVYGRDFRLGDLVTARVDFGSLEIERHKKITEVEVNVAAAGETVEQVRIEVADIPI
jgi:hypothetical protein